NITWWVINLVGPTGAPEEGGQSLLRREGGNNEILISDTTVFPVKARAKLPGVVASELNKARPKPGSSGGPGGNAPEPGSDVNAKIFQTARTFVGHSTHDVPGTDHGNLACAWAVNQVARLALGKPVQADERGRNGLSTRAMFDVLKD